MKWKNRLTNYNFWISIISAVLLILQNFDIQFDIQNLNEIVTAVLGLLVIIGIISDPTKTATINQPDNQTALIDKNKKLDIPQVIEEIKFKTENILNNSLPENKTAENEVEETDSTNSKLSIDDNKIESDNSNNKPEDEILKETNLNPTIENDNTSNSSIPIENKNEVVDDVVEVLNQIFVEQTNMSADEQCEVENKASSLYENASNEDNNTDDIQQNSNTDIPTSFNIVN